ncbi:hypothetical protein Cgig2_032155 [Carnegiea gigantea]|uniref:Uncharacterized protein n=1 Tax=Carnegiea gigantea TaxID=171969 RepID=A0A9Q1JNL8_9CARY|nr:hypothetical protein Cgig2_032155 [Carnegiea gigantea]
MGNNINKDYLLNRPQQLHQKGNNVHIVHNAKRNCKALYLSMMSRRRTNSQQFLKHKKEIRQHRCAMKAPNHLHWHSIFYCSPEFLEQVEQIESMARERAKQKKMMDFTPLSFSLGNSPEKGQSASRSLDISPPTLKFSFSPKGVGTAFITGVYYQRTNQATEMDDSFGKS